MEKNENKRSKRAAANINERRRMQSINNGFESLRELLNLTHKARLSKVTQTFIFQFLFFNA